MASLIGVSTPILVLSVSLGVRYQSYFDKADAMVEPTKTETAKASMSKADESLERGRDRSPSFPFISLEDAVKRATSFEAAHRRFAARIAVAAELWKLSPKSSTMLQTVAALKAYGLMKDSGSGGDRKIELTDLAQRILKDERPGNRAAAVKEAALKPRLVAEHWKKWGAERPPDATCLSDLHLDQKFTQDAARRFLGVYDDTISYAALTESDKVPELEAEVGGSTVAVPKGATADAPKPPAPPLRVKPMDAHLQDVFNVDEGQALIQWPGAMGQASYQDFVAWIEIVKRKIKRQIDAAEAAKESPAAGESSA